MNVVCRTGGARRPAAESRAVLGARRALRLGVPLPSGDVTLVWTTRARLRLMNRRFRRTDRFTDVIAFRYAPETPAPGHWSGPFGDLFIAVDQARRNARRFAVSASEEIVRLAVHGALHLLGHTDYTPAARARMWALQEPIVRAVMGRGLKRLPPPPHPGLPSRRGKEKPQVSG